MTKPVKDYVLPRGFFLGLRTCNPDLSSASEFANGFRWPASGPVKCPDWDPKAECGNGLHLLPFGEGLGNLLDFSDEAKWLVVEYETKLAIDLKGKVKIPNGTVVYCGDRNGATIWLRDHAERACKITGSTNTGGVRSTNTGGDSSTCKAGDMGAIAIWWWDKSTQRKRLTVGYVGENGIAPNTFYRCDDAGKLIKVA